MATTSDNTSPPCADSDADSGLRCPQCQYNLTGLTENRCPECGSVFDPEELRRLLAGEPSPIPGWDDGDKKYTLAAFFRVCWMTWFDPATFALSLVPVIGVGAIVLMVAIAVFLGSTLYEAFRPGVETGGHGSKCFWCTAP